MSEIISLNNIIFALIRSSLHCGSRGARAKNKEISFEFNYNATINLAVKRSPSFNSRTQNKRAEHQTVIVLSRAPERERKASEML